MFMLSMGSGRRKLRVVTLDDAEHEVHIVHCHGHIVAYGFVGHSGEFLGGIGPYFHAFALLYGEVLDQAVGDE